jgi:hypothetical protein
MMRKSSPQLPLNRRCKSKQRAHPPNGGCGFLCAEFSDFYRRLSCETNTSTINTAFEHSSKRRKGYPSETKVKRGARVVHGEKELVEKLGRNDLCPCGSGRCFQALLPPYRQIRRQQPRLLFSASSQSGIRPIMRSTDNRCSTSKGIGCGDKRGDDSRNFFSAHGGRFDGVRIITGGRADQA